MLFPGTVFLNCFRQLSIGLSSSLEIIYLFIILNKYLFLCAYWKNANLCIWRYLVFIISYFYFK